MEDDFSLLFSSLTCFSSSPLSPTSLPISCTVTCHFCTLWFLANFYVNNFQTYLSCCVRYNFIFPLSRLETCKLICQLRNKTHSNSNYHLPLTNVLLLLTFLFVWAQLTIFLVTHLQTPIPHPVPLSCCLLNFSYAYVLIFTFYVITTLGSLISHLGNTQ